MIWDWLGTTIIEILPWQPQGDAAVASGVCHGSPPRGVRRSSRGIRDPQSIMATTLRAKLDIMDVGPQGSFDWTKADSEPGSYTTGVDLASTLPPLVLEHLFSFLDLTSLKNCAQVCNRWNKYVLSARSIYPTCYIACTNSCFNRKLLTGFFVTKTAKCGEFSV